MHNIGWNRYFYLFLEHYIQIEDIFKEDCICRATIGNKCLAQCNNDKMQQENKIDNSEEVIISDYKNQFAKNNFRVNNFRLHPKLP